MADLRFKFRAWDKVIKNMLKPFTLWNQPITYKLNYTHYDLMQYTGLKDKNGKEIYEGDIITLNYGIPPTLDKLIIEYAYDEVIADISVSGWWMRNVRTNGCSSSLCKTYEGDIEVIGNIYENPELLEDK